jgi:hypothetical protein
MTTQTTTYRSFSELLQEAIEEPSHQASTITTKELLPVVAQLREKSFTYEEISDWLFERIHIRFKAQDLHETLRIAQSNGYFTNINL